MSTSELKLTEETLRLNSSRNTTTTSSNADGPIVKKKHDSPPPSQIYENTTSVTKYGIIDRSHCVLPSSRRPSSIVSSPRSRASSISSVGSHSTVDKMAKSRRKKADVLKVPEMFAGYMSKKCQFMTASWIKRYFWLQKGLLTNFLLDVDSVNPLKVEERARTVIQLKDYMLITDSSRNLLILESLNRNKFTRQNVTMHITLKQDYERWEFAMKEHVNYASGISPNTSNHNSSTGCRSKYNTNTLTFECNSSDAYDDIQKMLPSLLLNCGNSSDNLQGMMDIKVTSRDTDRSTF